MASGHVQDQAQQIVPTASYPQPLLLFRSEEGRSFANVSEQAGAAFASPLVGRAVCTGDIDNDGGVDAVVTNAEGQPLLLRNVAAGGGRWISLRLLDAGSNTQAQGARIILETSAGKRVHDVTTSGSIFAANDVRAHFGLGAREQVRGVTVRWPDGKTERFGPQEADRQVTLRRGAGIR